MKIIAFYILAGLVIAGAAFLYDLFKYWPSNIKAIKLNNNSLEITEDAFNHLVTRNSIIAVSIPLDKKYYYITIKEESVFRVYESMLCLKKVKEWLDHDPHFALRESETK